MGKMKIKKRIDRFDFDVTKDSYTFEQNRLDAHAEMNTEVMTECGWKSNRFLYLDGVWNFTYAKNHELAPVNFEKDECDCRYWDKIKVPGHIQMQGYDKPHYTNTAYPWDSVEKVGLGEVPEKFNPVGTYVKYFNIPGKMLGENIRISFQGVESAGAVWLNGIYVGYMTNSFNPSDFDITEYVRAGENKLAVQVFKWVVGSWCEDQDFFRFSGIYRSVYIYSCPKVHIEDVKIRAVPDKEYRNGLFDAEVKLSGTKDEKYSVRAELRDGAKTVATDLSEAKPVTELSCNIKKVRLWSAEKPNLYELTVTVLDENGNPVEKVTNSVGFREFVIKNGILLLNGRRIVFKGVNRHEFSARSGRAVTDEEILQDIVTMKQNNINAIRTSHYPDDVRIYDLCDRYGIYMIAENNMETHGTWCIFNAKEHMSEVIPCDDLKWEPMLLDRVNSCYQRDKNHPAILMWSCGNESFGGLVIKHMSDKFKELDPDRPVHYEGVCHDERYPETSDVVSRMYPPAFAVEEHLKKDSSKPYVLCEYSHAMGNSCGALHKYTELADRLEGFQGGFIWDYIDQSIFKKDRYGNEFQAYGGDFGDRPSDYNFSGNGIVYGGDRKPSPKMQEVKFCYQNFDIVIDKKKILIKNKNLFTSSDEYNFTVHLLKNGHPIDKKQLETDVKPLSEKSYKNPFSGLTEEAEYSIIASFTTKTETPWCGAGHEVAFGQYIFKVCTDSTAVSKDAVKAADGTAVCKDAVKAADSTAVSKDAVKAADGTAVCKGENGACEADGFEIIHGQQNISVKGNNFEVMFVHGMGGIVSYRYCGKEYINIVPKPNFWRAPTDNDAGNRMVARMAQWKIASLYVSNKGMRPWEINYPRITEREKSLELTYTYRMPTTPESSCTVTYTVNADGRIDVEMHYIPVAELGDMPEFGMMYVLDADLCNLEWYGLGPQETYADRCHGGKIGIYRNKVADNMASYLKPQECGNKVGVRYAKVTDNNGDGLIFTSDEASFSALPYTPHEIENASHSYELPQIHHTVVRIAKAQMGVGGDDSWGAPVHKEYHIDVSEELVFNYSFKGMVREERQ